MIGRLQARGLAACVLGVLSAAPAVAEGSAAPNHDPLWTALGLGAVLVVAYGVTRAVARPLMARLDGDDDRHAELLRAESAALRACADDLAQGVAATDADGRLLFVNRFLRQRSPDLLPGRRLADVCGDGRVDGLLRRVADTGRPLATEIHLPMGPARVRAVPAESADDGSPPRGAVLFVRLGAAPVPAAAAAAVPAPSTMGAGRVRLDLLRRRACVDASPLDLTETEFRLLAYLVSRPDQVLSRAQLLREVWGHKAAVYSRTVDTHVQRLRDKLGPVRDALETVRGAGYRFRDR